MMAMCYNSDCERVEHYPCKACDCNMAHQCEEYVSGRPTNADRIRAMSDEELAENRVVEIVGIAPCPLWVAIDAPEKQYLSKKRAVEVELAWLQQPAPEVADETDT